ncbi:hypothetical protein [Asanoa siamensis]|uniref:Lipoprotein n=1 Tax=Asanoa siamensis TaxID=926357 RepID=A0ABQ4CY22_9ACTN|nr:hypothetical protein [Asanoa siamensis]GIF75727.1 hypothetical protein Asi02nite_52450 [Asanoa siamensis]
MHRNRFVLTGFAVAVVIAVSGCEQASTSEGPAQATGAPTPAVTSAAPTSAAPTTDAATVQACADIKKDIAENAKTLVETEKIGPPAGHIAVSAQWAAASAVVISHSIGASGPVGAAAEKVQKEMMALSDEYNKSANAKPSKKKLEAAVAELNAACA